MADNTTLNVGSGGDVIASDDIGGIKFQRIKVVHGVDGTNDGDTSNTNPFPVRVNETADSLQLTLSLDTAAYAIDDVLAATQELASVTRANAGTAMINNIVVIDKDDQKQPMQILFLKTNVSIGTENAAVSISDADAVEILGEITIEAGDYSDLGGVSIATPKTTPFQPFIVKAGADTTSIYVAVISKGTGTYTASGVILNIGRVYI